MCMFINQTQRRKGICTLRDWDVLTPYLAQNALAQGDLCVIERASNKITCLQTGDVLS